MTAHYAIHEMAIQEGLSLPVDASVIAGVKVIGNASANGRFYPQAVIQEAFPLYEGCRVNVNHILTPGQHRDLRDRFGKLQNFRLDPEGTPRADLHYNPAHPMAESVRWFAEHMPDALGLSHDAVAAGTTKNNIFVVDKIISVKSVDLVANPATTKGLFESADMSTPVLIQQTVEDEAAAATDDGKDYKDHLAEMVKSIMCDESMDRATKRSKILTALKLHDDVDDDKKDDANKATKTDGQEAADGKPAPLGANEKALREELDAVKAQLAAAARQSLVTKLVAEAKLPAFALTDVFTAQLTEAKDEAEIKRLIEDRRALAGVQKPRSQSPGNSGNGGKKPTDLDQFTRALKGR